MSRFKISRGLLKAMRPLAELSLRDSTRITNGTLKTPEAWRARIFFPTQLMHRPPSHLEAAKRFASRLTPSPFWMKKGHDLGSAASLTAADKAATAVSSTPGNNVDNSIGKTEIVITPQNNDGFVKQINELLVELSSHANQVFTLLDYLFRIKNELSEEVRITTSIEQASKLMERAQKITLQILDGIAKDKNIHSQKLILNFRSLILKLSNAIDQAQIYLIYLANSSYAISDDAANNVILNSKELAVKAFRVMIKIANMIDTQQGNGKTAFKQAKGETEHQQNEASVPKKVKKPRRKNKRHPSTVSKQLMGECANILSMIKNRAAYKDLPSEAKLSGLKQLRHDKEKLTIANHLLPNLIRFASFKDSLSEADVKRIITIAEPFIDPSEKETIEDLIHQTRLSLISNGGLEHVPMLIKIDKDLSAGGNWQNRMAIYLTRLPYKKTSGLSDAILEALTNALIRKLFM